MKRIVLAVPLGIVLALLVSGCGKYSYVENTNGLSVFLNERNGNVIYVDDSNRIVDRVKLGAGPDDRDGANKAAAMSGREWGTREIPGTDFKVSFYTRFYNNQLLYKIEVEPYNNRTLAFARTVVVKLMDDNGFVLGTIPTVYDWTQNVDGNGEPVAVEATGNIMVTLGHYLEIGDWSPLWSSRP